MKLISIKKASKLLGVHPQTLRRWEREELITSYKTTGGHRRYNLNELLNQLKEQHEKP